MENGCDSVEVFDGDLSTSISLHKHSGSTKPELIVSSGNKLKVHLLSDQLYSGTGFLAQYKASKFDEELFFCGIVDRQKAYSLISNKPIDMFHTENTNTQTYQLSKQQQDSPKFRFNFGIHAFFISIPLFHFSLSVAKRFNELSLKHCLGVG